MKKTIRLPAPPLSILKEVNVDLNMTGRHYALLADCEGQLPEDVALSILRDLVDEDASQLTLSEIRYVFIMVKINSMENNYIVSPICDNIVNGKECGCINQYKVYLSDADLNPTPPNYKVPTIKFRKGDTEKEYKVLPPPIADEIKLYDFFFTEFNATQDQIYANKKLRYDYSFLRSLLHLVDSDGNRFIKPEDNYKEYIDKASLKENPKTIYNLNTVSMINNLFDAVNEVNSYGVQPKIYEIKCKRCHGTIKFQLPLLNGLIDRFEE